MAAFDPRKFLKQISNSQLQQFFSNRGELLDLPWDDLTEHKVEPVFEAMQELPDDAQDEIQLVFQDIHYLSPHRGIEALAEQINWKRPYLADGFREQPGRQDKVMFVHLQAPDLIESAALFASADRMEGGRSWCRSNGLPKQKLQISEELLAGFASEISGYYAPRQMRGSRCQVVHQRRSDESDYFFAYLDDYPDNKPEFVEDSDEPRVRSARDAFENVFVYNAQVGSLELSAKGGKPVREAMQIAFCRSVLGEEQSLHEISGPAYKLDHLLERNFPLPIEPGDGIESVRITFMRLEQTGIKGYVEIKCDHTVSPDAIYREIERSLNPDRFKRPGVRVRQAGFSVSFAQSARGNQPTAKFSVTVPYTCNLNERPEVQRAAIERCLKRWGIAHDC